MQDKVSKSVQIIYDDSDGYIICETHFLEGDKSVCNQVALDVDWAVIQKAKESEGFIFVNAKDYDDGTPYKLLIRPEDIDCIDAYESGHCEINPHEGFFELHVNINDLPDELRRFIVRN